MVIVRRIPRPGAQDPWIIEWMNDLHCTHCGATGLDLGYVEDTGLSAYARARWIAGELQRDTLGRAKRTGGARHEIDAYRCKQCSHLELFVKPDE